MAQAYPRSLYRQRDDVAPEYEFDGVKCEMLTVESEEEEEDAKAEGWHNTPAEAGAPAKPAKKAEPAKKGKK